MSTWILVRGLTREQGHWGRFITDLQAALRAGEQILTPDLPGNGALCDRRSPMRVEELVEHLRRTLKSEGHPPPYRVIAMSLGAMVTVDWAHRYPQELDAAVLINTSLRPYSPFWHRLRPQQYPRIVGLLLRQADGPTWERAIMAMTTCHPSDAAATLQQWITLRRTHPVQVANGLRQLWAAARYRAPAHAPQVPLLLLNGQGDQLVHPDCSAALASAWSLPLLRHPTAGHDLPLDAGPWVAAQVQAWLAQPPSPALRPGPPADPG